MDKQEFIKKFNNEKLMYECWGEYVGNIIISHITKHNKLNPKTLLQIPAVPRVKELDSLLYKAFYREDKNYKNPYDEIEDKVGIRFVVLYKNDVTIINNAIEDINIWNVSKDRDFEEQREINPEYFGYESVHYIVRNKDDIKVDDIIIKANTPCEIQIRTLLQHAYCQVSHNTMYKKSVVNKSKRTLSRSMAIIESADIFFEEVKTVVNQEEKEYKDLLYDLTEYYNTFCQNLSVEDKFNNMIIETFRDFLYKDIIKDIKNFIESKKYIKKSIKDLSTDVLIYRQPIILLMYFLVWNKRNMVEELWPITFEELEYIYTDLGISFNC
ncbi:GTP pyrophosphokinase [Romboutsia ilealis]|uniref:GTP pyrophosphokinase n=1 Tax=Romboutsia ilealis TaxID=1115758 RepID=UPI0025B79696|nr:RelA/SpoT domain-containing protein [Romboutsia ilealis]